MIDGSKGQIPVFLKPERILLSEKACCQAGQKTLQKALLIIEIIPRLLNIRSFRPLV
jgi:hypothetical protein